MDHETPKPMKKVHRNIFHKVGKKLEKFEQSINPHLSRDSTSSSSDLSSSYHSQNAESYEEEDAVSLQHHPHSESSSVVPRHKHANQIGRPRSSGGLNNVNSNSQWQLSTDDYDSSRQYDQEMKAICTELLEDNRSVRLNDCRDYDKKVSLLRIAGSFDTPKVTVPVILFLENTLSKPLFYELIKKHRSAVKNYINMAKFRLDNDYYIAMLKQFDKKEEVAMIRLRQASQTKDINSKTALLDQAAIDVSSHHWWHLQIAEYQHFLHKQRELERSLSTSLENQTVLETYKIVYDVDFRRQKNHRQNDRTTVEQSRELETAFHMSPEMVMCGKLSVIMRCGLRMHFEDFFHQALHQSIFGKKYVIAPENYADMVYNWVIVSGEGQAAASDKAEKFLNMIPDPKRRIYYAERFQNYNVAMDTIVHVFRDRAQLESLRKRMPPDHPSFNRATSLLENTKWRN